MIGTVDVHNNDFSSIIDIHSHYNFSTPLSIKLLVLLF
jgi:hypothetical protein